MGSSELASTLKSATLRWNSEDRTKPQNAEEYVSLALEREFDAFDLAFYDANPSVYELLSARVPKRFVVAD
jgi:hypothetical protein